ncbi:hypothetical protein [Leisingera thetidis]|uniref:hypothetical protein n=1 Tax=Leisingera thetidis TaxID=2930199 RepID=UPI0021F6BF26|nr:hypothetical protein [Leisingera thetidis]
MRCRSTTLPASVLRQSIVTVPPRLKIEDRHKIRRRQRLPQHFLSHCVGVKDTDFRHGMLDLQLSFDGPHRHFHRLPPLQHREIRRRSDNAVAQNAMGIRRFFRGKTRRTTVPGM